MTKAELVSQVAEQSNLTKKTTEAVLKSLIGAVHQALKDKGGIRIDGLGTFKVIERKARTGVNPQTGAKLDIPATKAPAFRAAKSLREVVKK
jgi:DNA-binding protein HU-beta